MDSTIQERLIDIQSDDDTRIVFHKHGWQIFGIKCRESYPDLQK